MQRRRIAALIIASLLTIPAATVPAAAFHDPAPLLDERAIEGPFWFVYRVSVSNADNVVSYELSEPESENRHQVAYGLWTVPVANPDDDFFFIGTGGTRTTEAHIHWDEPTTVDQDAGPLVGSSGVTNGFAVTHTDVAVGDYWLVIVNTGPWMTNATVRLYGSAGVSLQATGQGAEGDLFRETDFETDEPYHHVRTGAVTFTAQAHDLHNASLAYEAEHSLFGIFRLSGGERREMSRLQPDGSVDTAKFGSLVLSNDAPGVHEFRIDHWEVAPRAGFGPDAYAAVLVADVDLPEA